MNIAVYCSSRSALPEHYKQLAIALGTWLGKQGHTLVYGGSNAGLMHITAQAVKQAGGHIVGVIPEFFRHLADPLVDELIVTTDMIDRKQRMIALAHHFVVLPGGLGTIEEWLTTLSHFTATHDYGHRIVVTNPDDIYDHMSQQILATCQSPMAHGRPLDIVRYVTTAEQLLAELQELS